MTISKFLFNDPVNKMTIRHMGYLVRQSELVAGNIANADTPGYKSKDLDFQKTLERIANGQNESNIGQMTQTNPRHVTGLVPESEGVKVIEDKSSPRLDKNSVNVESELQKSAEIAIRYDLLATYLKHKSGLLREALSSES